jgi:hypothetical protein
MLTERAQVAGRAAPRPTRAETARALGFDWAMAALSAWFLGGLYLDGWAHNHGMVDDSFFTPWHAVFYSGFAAVALLSLAALARGVLAGRPWYRALPPGHELALLGVPLFALGGAGDLAWHTAFGIEEGVEALISPSHLALAVSMGLILVGPLRAAARREMSPAHGYGGWLARGPAALSLAFFVALLAFMTQFAHPFVHLIARSGRYGDVSDALGVAAVLLQTALLFGPLLFAMRRVALPPGVLTLTLALATALIALMEDRYELIGAAALAGLCGDLLLALLRPGAARPLAQHAFAFAAPLLLYLLYFLALHLTGGVRWSIHMWMGATFLAGIAGLLLSLLTSSAAPAGPERGGSRE